MWEGTTNVLASETIRHLTRGDNLAIFGNWVENSVSKVRNADNKQALGSAWRLLKQKIASVELVDALADGRQIMFTLAWLLSGLLLALDAQRDNEEVAVEVAWRWILDGEGVPGEFAFRDIVHVGSASLTWRRPSGRERTNWDCRIVWGVDLPQDSAVGYRVESKL